MDKYSVDKTIKYIINSRKNFTKLDIIDYMPKSEKEAYQIQTGVHAQLNNLSDPIVGKKNWVYHKSYAKLFKDKSSMCWNN